MDIENSEYYFFYEDRVFAEKYSKPFDKKFNESVPEFVARYEKNRHALISEAFLLAKEIDPIYQRAAIQVFDKIFERMSSVKNVTVFSREFCDYVMSE